MASEFGTLLRDLIERVPMTREKFAEKTKIGAAFVSNLISGARTPPPEKFEIMADVLGLHGREREHFFDLATLAHLPRELQPRWLGIIRRLHAVEDRLNGR